MKWGPTFEKQKSNYVFTICPGKNYVNDSYNFGGSTSGV